MSYQPPSIEAAVIYDHAISFVAKASEDLASFNDLVWVRARLRDAADACQYDCEREVIAAMCKYIDAQLSSMQAAARREGGES